MVRLGEASGTKPILSKAYQNVWAFVTWAGSGGSGLSGFSGFPATFMPPDLGHRNDR